jgi:predicted  nucleic acid-binding Zn-ribbon protein
MTLTRMMFAAGVAAALGGSAAAQQKLTYDQHILPLLRDKCLGCHDADKTRGGLDASTYGKLMEGGSSGAVVKPGDADGSRLYTLSAHTAEPKMPPNAPPLAKASLDTLKAWIDAGAPENAGSKVAAVKKNEVAVKATAFVRPAVPPLPEKPLAKKHVKTARANAVTALACSPWAPLAAVASPRQVLLYNTDTLDLVGVLPFPHGQINALKFSRSGELLLAAGGRGGKLGKAVLYSVKTGDVVADIGDEPDAIIAADLSPDQREIAVGGTGRVVRVYSTADGSKVHTLKKHTEWVTGVEYSPDGKYLATGDRNGGVVLWEAATGREHQVLAGHKSAVTGICWRDDAAIVATSSEEGNVKLWEPEEGKATKTISVPGAQSVRYAHDGRLVTTGRDQKTRLFDANGNLQREFTGISELALHVAVTHDQGRALTGDWSGAVHVWQLADGKKVGQLSTNPPTREERLEAARQELAAKQKAVEAAQKAFDEARGSADAASTELAAVRKAIADLQMGVRQATERFARAKQANDQLANDLSAAKKAAADAEAKMKAARTAAGQEKDKAKAGDAAKALAEAEEKLKAARQRLADLQGRQKATADELTAARKARDEAPAKAKQAQEAEGPKAKAAQAAEQKAAVARANLDNALAERAAAEKAVEKYARPD